MSRSERAAWPAARPVDAAVFVTKFKNALYKFAKQTFYTRVSPERFYDEIFFRTF